MKDTIDNFMTKHVQTVEASCTLREVYAIMRDRKIRHLPVLEAKRLVGIVSERDLTLVETFGYVNSETLAVAEVMSEEVFVVEPTASVRAVARRMAREKLGSAVIVSGGNVIGIFTVIDALRALDAIFDDRAAA